MKPFTQDEVVFSAQAACILEVSVEKPGNVGPTQDFIDTRFEDFLMSGIFIGSGVRKAVKFGMNHEPGKGGLGSLIYEAVEGTRRRHGGRNTNLGLVMLLIPLSAACGICIKKDNFTIGCIRTGISTVIGGSTPEDTLRLYDAIVLADAEVGRSRRFDVKDPRSKKNVSKRGMNLEKIFQVSQWDSISKELCTEMEITFTVGYPAFKREFENTHDLRRSVLKCFFEILSRVPDTLIERKMGREWALKVSAEAGEILNKGLPAKELELFNSWLIGNGNKLNPGTTADLVGASLMISLLDGVYGGEKIT
jgi:triphosphoribosyl-dephospho-CoA synthase